MDNLSAHKGEKVRKLIEARGCKLIFLPPYAPDLNPIEEEISKIKGLLRKRRPRMVSEPSLLQDVRYTA